MLKSAVAIFILLLFIGATPVEAHECKDIPSTLNKIVAINPDSVVLKRYEGLDALSYINYVNSYPSGMDAVFGDIVIVMGDNNYPGTIVLVFHDHDDKNCLVSGIFILRMFHDKWDLLIGKAL